jgi:hypothetical protein
MTCAAVRSAPSGVVDPQVGSPDVHTTIETVARGAAVRRAIAMPADEELVFRVRLPMDARLDFGMGVIEPMPVTFRVSVLEADSDPRVLFEEEYADAERWEAHRELGQMVQRASPAILTQEQIETLRSLGYLR